jgi:hypothetical protein
MHSVHPFPGLNVIYHVVGLASTYSGTKGGRPLFSKPEGELESFSPRTPIGLGTGGATICGWTICLPAQQAQHGTVLNIASTSDAISLLAHPSQPGWYPSGLCGSLQLNPLSAKTVCAIHEQETERRSPSLSIMAGVGNGQRNVRDFVMVQLLRLYRDRIAWKVSRFIKSGPVGCRLGIQTPPENDHA